MYKFAKHYLACGYVDYGKNGRCYIEFEFTSHYRADSKVNKEDARKYYKNRCGRDVVIERTTLMN